MPDEYSIETRATRIFDARTKEYFSEVLSCYAAGHYRSSVVMLWSVAVCDLLFKLQNLVDVYGDTKAQNILAEIGKLQQDNERSPVWETKLVELVVEQTQLLDIAERENLLYLQRQRHLAAHPVIISNFQLHRPNRETARALIRKTLDGVLIKAPILSKKIVDELVRDLDQESGVLIDDKKLLAYVQSKYFSRFSPEVEKVVFRALWKFVFRVTGGPCEKNRAINDSALRLLFARNPAQFQALVGADKDYFSAIATAGTPVVYVIHFLSREPEIFNLLADHAKTVIQHVAENGISARCLAWFTVDSLHEHAVRLREWMTGEDYPQIDRGTWEDLKAISDSPEWGKEVVGLANVYYVACRSYDRAAQRFNEVIRPLLANYDLADCVDLITRIESNGQTWERRGASVDHRELLARAIDLDSTFNPALYKVFNKHLDT